jgi:hypothetical protein
LYFDGNDKVTLPAFSLSGTVISIIGWVKTIEHTSGQAIIGDASQASDVGFIWFWRIQNSDDAYWKYATGSSATQVSFPDIFSGYENDWVHFAVISDYSGASVKFYRNGELIQTSAMTTPLFPSTSRVRYLGSYGSSYYLYCGYLDDIRIYNRELSASEIKAIYEGTK